VHELIHRHLARSLVLAVTADIFTPERLQTSTDVRSTLADLAVVRRARADNFHHRMASGHFAEGRPCLPIVVEHTDLDVDRRQPDSRWAVAMDVRRRSADSRAVEHVADPEVDPRLVALVEQQRAGDPPLLCERSPPPSYAPSILCGSP
jgi:hypothetical protein